jgi:hypothetical protein
MQFGLFVGAKIQLLTLIILSAVRLIVLFEFGNGLISFKLCFLLKTKFYRDDVDQFSLVHELSKHRLGVISVDINRDATSRFILFRIFL